MRRPLFVAGSASTVERCRRVENLVDRPTAIGHEPFDRAYNLAANELRFAGSVLGPNLGAEHVAARLRDWSLDGAELLALPIVLVLLIGGQRSRRQAALDQRRAYPAGV